MLFFYFILKKIRLSDCEIALGSVRDLLNNAPMQSSIRSSSPLILISRAADSESGAQAYIVYIYYIQIIFVIWQ